MENKIIRILLTNPAKNAAKNATNKNNLFL